MTLYPAAGFESFVCLYRHSRQNLSCLRSHFESSHLGWADRLESFGAAGRSPCCESPQNVCLGLRVYAGGSFVDFFEREEAPEGRPFGHQTALISVPEVHSNS